MGGPSPDPVQTRLLDHERGPVLLSGPPGSGKTWLLRERFCRLVEAGVPPERIALFTLNRRATRDARDWIVHRLKRSVPELPVFTVHGFAFRVVGRRFDEIEGFDEPPEILSAADQYAVVRQMLRAERREDWPELARLLDSRGFAQQVADLVLRAQERLISPDELDTIAERSGRERYREVAGFYRRYLEEQRARRRTDYAGLLGLTVELLEKELRHEEVFRHLLVDDYQDATPATERIVQALGRAADSLVVAADPHGHVFSYRGGTLEPLERAREALGVRETIRLERSHRLGAEQDVLRALEDPSAEPAATDGRVEAHLFAHPGEEAEAVAAELLRLRVEDDVAWNEMAVVLRRYGPYLSNLRLALARHGIPFVVVAEAADVAAEPANRPIIDLLRYVFRAERSQEVLERVLGSTVGGLDPHEIRRLRREARMRDVDLAAVIHDAPPDDIPPAVRDRLLTFRAIVEELPERAEKEGPDGVFFWLWSTLPHVQRLVGSEDATRDLDALSALADVIARFVERRPGATVDDYLDTLDAAEFSPDPWMPPEERYPDAVRVVSAHRAHGVEFEVVLIPGTLEGEFPALSRREPLVSIEALVSPASPRERRREHLAEERALFRLAVSRARRRTVLFASHSPGTRTPRTPSRFAARQGLTWKQADEHARPPATSHRSFAADLRRRIADPSLEPPVRLAALAALRPLDLDPMQWWWMREWSDPGVPIYTDEIRTSYSKLSTLENCGLQYLYSAELGLDFERSHYMWVGSLVHAIIDRVQQGKLERTEEAVLHALDEGWNQKVFPNLALERQRYRDVRDMLLRWLRDEDTQQLELAASEQWFDFPLDGARIRGRIDAIFRQENGTTRVRDYKTGRSAPTREELKEHLQLMAYYLAMREDPELRAFGRPSVLELSFLAQEAYGTFRSMPFPPPADYGERAERTLRAHLQSVREERFAPSPEAECRNCSFKTICPVWPQGAEVLE